MRSSAASEDMIEYHIARGVALDLPIILVIRLIVAAARYQLHYQIGRG
jgi:hypothetical protein